MILIFPKDCNPRIISTESRKKFPNHISSKYWEHHEQTGEDHGIDMIIELVENEEYHNDKIECQIKGTTQIDKYSKKNYISYPIEIKTINYGLNSKNAFALILVDIVSDVAYYVILQEFFMNNPGYLNKISDRDGKFSIHINYDDYLTESNSNKLINIAKTSYKRKNNGEIIKIT